MWTKALLLLSGLGAGLCSLDPCMDEWIGMISCGQALTNYKNNGHTFEEFCNLFRNKCCQTCLNEDCPAPAPVAHSTKDSDKTMYSPGDTLTYTCNTGYAQSGSLQRECLKDGTWSGTTPACKIPAGCMEYGLLWYSCDSISQNSYYSNNRAEFCRLFKVNCCQTCLSWGLLK